MNDRDWRTLVHNIESGNCILVLGPDIPREKVGGKSKSLNQILANMLAQEVESELKVLDRDDLFSTAQQYADFTSEEDLRLETAEFYKTRQIEVGSPYSDIVHLPFQLIVNATPDTLLVRAMEQAGKEYLSDLYNYRGRPSDMVKWDTREKPLIYNLYGSVEDHDSLVVSEKHLLEFLVAVTAKDPPIPNNIMSEFRDKDKSFLFLGFGFRNWYLRVLLYVLLDSRASKLEKTSRSFALEEETPSDDPSLQQVSYLFKDDLKINFADMHVDEFAKELRQRFETRPKPENGAQQPASQPQSSSSKPKPAKAKSGTREPATEEIAVDAPTIFICHASEDKETAMRIWEHLREGGMDPWIDKEGIRGGDQWDQLLEKQIKGVDYFVVVQSKAMADKAMKKSYVNKEITLALEERMHYPAQIAFILPVKIEECESREEFSDWQSTDLTNFDNIENLLKDIRRDWQRRKK